MTNREALRSGQDPKAKKLARLNRRITRLSSELETLAFMQGRLERELESGERPIRKIGGATRKSS